MRKRRLAAPIIVTVLLILFYVLYFGVLLVALKGVWRYVVGIVPLAISALTIKVCMERIHEIKKGEEDDISKY